MITMLRKNLFLAYALSYAAILIIPVFVILWLSTHQLSEKREDALRASQAEMERNVENIENRLDEIVDMVQIISVSRNLENVLQASDSGYFASYQLFREMENLCRSSAFIQGMYVMLEDRDRIIGSDGLISDVHQFYRMKYDLGENGYDAWLGEQAGAAKDAARISLVAIRDNFERKKCVLFVHPLISNAITTFKQGRVYVYLSTEQLQSQIADSEELESFAMSLAGNEIRLVEKANGKSGHRVSLEQVSSMGIRYVGVYLEDALLTDWYAQMVANTLVIAMAGLIGGFFCIWFAWKNSRPIMQMAIQLAQRSGEGQSECLGTLDYVQGSMSRLINDRQQLGMELQKRLTVLQVAFIERLLGGTCGDLQDLDAQLLDLHIRLRGDFFCVVLFMSASYGLMSEGSAQQDSRARLVIERVVSRLGGENQFAYSPDARTTVLILGMAGEQDQEVVHRLVKRMVDEMNEAHGVGVQAAIGLPCRTLAETSRSCLQARKALDASVAEPGQTVRLYQRERNEAVLFCFPLELEARLIRSAVQGSEAQVRAIEKRESLRQYIGERFADPNMNLAMIAGVFGVSEVYMSRMFKAHLGCNFTDYLEQLRMAHASRLLCTTGKTVREVALESGYASPHAFRRAYKRRFGNIPSERRGSL